MGKLDIRNEEYLTFYRYSKRNVRMKRNNIYTTNVNRPSARNYTRNPEIYILYASRVRYLLVALLTPFALPPLELIGFQAFQFRSFLSIVQSALQSALLALALAPPTECTEHDHSSCRGSAVHANMNTLGQVCPLLGQCLFRSFLNFLLGC